MSISANNKTGQIVYSMDSISLEDMDHVKLMRRRDTKFVLPVEKVFELLNHVKKMYRVLEIDGERIHAYETLYYDTPDFDMYKKHHNGRLNRFKVRVRKYMTSNISFLEVKFKNNRRETIKKRIKPEEAGFITGGVSEKFLLENSPYSSNEIAPALQNYFKRITLVHRTIPERITIDLDVRFSDIDGKKTLDLPHLSVIEVKRDRDSNKSDMIELLRKNHIRSMGFSKYCMGTAMINPNVKTNLFKIRLRHIKKYQSAIKRA